MITEETTTQEQAQEQETLHNQNGEPTELAVPQTHISIEDFVRATELAKELKNKQRGASIVPKYHEFTTSVKMVEDNANQIKETDKTKEAEKRQAYIEQNMPFTSTVGFFQGVSQQIITQLETIETGEVKNEKTQWVTSWINENGLFVNFGVQLARACEKLEKGTPIEIVFSHEEPTKNGGTVKIYEVYPLI